MDYLSPVHQVLLLTGQISREMLPFGPNKIKPDKKTVLPFSLVRNHFSTLIYYNISETPI
jgi:hypothetical protein